MKSWNGFSLTKLPLCGASEESDDARVYFEWPTVQDLRRMVESVPSFDQRAFQLSRIESTAYSVVQSLRFTLANGFKSPQIGKYKAFNAEWNAPQGVPDIMIRSVQIRHNPGSFVESVAFHGDYVDVGIEGSNTSG